MKGEGKPKFAGGFQAIVEAVQFSPRAWTQAIGPLHILLFFRLYALFVVFLAVNFVALTAACQSREDDVSFYPACALRDLCHKPFQM